MSSEPARQLANQKQGDHVCPIYESIEEQMASAVPFTKEGLARDERCLYVADDRTLDGSPGRLLLPECLSVTSVGKGLCGY